MLLWVLLLLLLLFFVVVVVVAVVVVVVVVVVEVVEPGKSALKLIVKQFGNEVLQSDGTLDRKKLGKLIFEDESKRYTLNKCTLPYIQRAMIWEIIKYFLKGKQWDSLCSTHLKQNLPIADTFWDHN